MCLHCADIGTGCANAGNLPSGTGWLGVWADDMCQSWCALDANRDLWCYGTVAFGSGTIKTTGPWQSVSMVNHAVVRRAFLRIELS